MAVAISMGLTDKVESWHMIVLCSFLAGSSAAVVIHQGWPEYPDYLETYYAPNTRPYFAGACNASGFELGGSIGTSFTLENAATAGECCTLCAANVRCGHFNYQPSTKKCKLKEGRLLLDQSREYADYISGAPATLTRFPPASPTPSQTPPWTRPKPHIVFIMGDDVGHYNMGFRGNVEARTPYIDALVKEGLILDRHYVYKYCSPTRTSFLSGRLPVHMSEKMSELPDVNGIDVRATTIAQKLAGQGYDCHQIGKYHAGSAFEGQLPYRKGFKSSFGYLSGEEDHYTQVERGFVDLWDTDKPAYGKNGTQYGAFLYNQRAVSIIASHDPRTPLFLYLAWQNTHTPNEVPEEFRGPKLDLELRQTYEGMMHCLDSGIGNVTSALKAKGMWNNTLLIFSSDNGGRVDKHFGANNYPLRGMKFSDFEGGVRVAAFASGGLIPKARHGKIEAGMIHVADWYATFCNMAGCNPSDPAAGPDTFPDVDAVDQTWTLLNGAASPRQNRPLPLSASALIIWPNKLVLGDQQSMGVWTGPHHPNSSVRLVDNDRGCGTLGCLFDIEADPTEHNDLSTSQPHLLKQMKMTLANLQSGFWQSNSDVTGNDPVYSQCVSQHEAKAAHKGFASPVCTKPDIQEYV